MGDVIEFPYDRIEPARLTNQQDNVLTFTPRMPDPPPEKTSSAKARLKKKFSIIPDDVGISRLAANAVAMLFPGDINPYEDIVLKEDHFVLFTLVCCSLLAVKDGNLGTKPIDRSRVESIVSGLTRKEKSDIVHEVIEQYRAIWR